MPSADFSAIQLSQFADHELDVPYHLRHFAQVANSVVENSTTINGVSYPRGFLNIKVNREPADNMPYNARILEMQMVLAYFYTADRPWNQYRGSVPVRQRLEAMMNLWTNMQAPEGSTHAGLFAEYSASNWSMAPTSFGIMAAAQALDMILASGLPFDETILNNAKVSIRRALMALFTRTDMRAHARSWSNQFNGSYHAALIYLERWPDAELQAAFVKAVTDSGAQDQSPAGFWYEQDGPDFGYSGVHDNNLRVAWPRLRGLIMTNASGRNIVDLILEDEGKWNDWLAANMVLQPGLSPNTFFTSAGLNTRTSHVFQTPRSRPLAEFATNSRTFALTDTEFASSLTAKRSSEQSRFGNYGTLNTNSAYSYIPAFVYDAARPSSSVLNSWHPTAAQRDMAIASLPSRSTNAFSKLFHNDWPGTGTFSLGTVNRANYYATFASGNRRLPRQAYGLNLLWSPSFGLALQAVSGSPTSVPWQWGTVRGTDVALAYETGHMPGTIRAGTNTITPVAGVATLPAGEYSVSYALTNGGTVYGQKSVTLGGSNVTVVVAHTNVFTEYLPLAYASDATLNTNSGSRLVLQRPNGSSVLLQLNSPASINPGTASSDAVPGGMVRRGVTIRATNTLSYTLTVSDTAPPAEITTPSISISDAAVSQPTSGSTNAVLTVRLSAPPSSAVTVDYASENGTASAGTEYTATGGTLSFAQGQTVNTITVPVAAGSLAQGSAKNFSVKLSNPANATISRGTASVTINGSTVPPPPPAGSVRAEFVPGNAWSSAYQGTLKIINNSAANITSWIAEFDFDGSLITFFNGSATRTGNRVTFAPASWQSLVPAGTTFDNLGFQASPNGEAYHPRNIRLRIREATNFSPLTVLTGAELGVSGLGASLRQPLSAGGGIGPYTWSLVAGSELPSGLALTSDGMIIGTPTTAGVFSFTLRVGDMMDKTADRTFHLMVNAPLSVETAALPNAVAGKPYGQMLGAVGGEGPYTWSLVDGLLPAGLSMASDGTISGTALSAGEAVFTLRVTDAAEATATRGFSLAVVAPLAVPPAILPGAGNDGSFYHEVLTAEGGSAPYVWSVAAGALPEGLTLSASGEVSGVPSVSGVFSFTARVQDADGHEAAAEFSITITEPLALTTALLPSAASGVVYAQELSASGGTEPYTWSLASGSLPAGLTLSSDGVVTGIPFIAGTSSFAVRVTDASAEFAEVSFSIAVAPPSSLTWDADTVAGGQQNGAGTWSAGGSNWLTGAVNTPWVEGYNAVFGGGAGLGGVITLDGDRTVGNVTFDATTEGSGYTLTGSGSLTLEANSVITANSEGIINVPLRGTSFTKAGTGRLVLDDAGYEGNVGVSGELRLVEKTNRTWSGVISGGGTIAKHGGGTLTLAGSNPLTGFFTVTGNGALRVTHDHALGTTHNNTAIDGGSNASSVIIDGHGLELGESFHLVMHNKSNAPHFQLRNVGGTNSVGGHLLLNGGGARWDIGSESGRIRFNGAVSNVVNVTAADTWRTLYLTGPGSGEFNGTMENATNGLSRLNVTVVSGDWTLGGSNKTYTGSTVVSNGTLRVETGLASPIDVKSGGTLAGGGSTATNLLLQNGATFAVALSNWSMTPPAFTANRVTAATNNTNWTIRLDAAGLDGFEETDRTIPVLRSLLAWSNINLASIILDTGEFVGRGTWNLTSSNNTLSLVYTAFVDPFGDWAVSIPWNGADSSPEADPDRDGISNLVEYALSMDPMAASVLPPGFISTLEGEERLAMNFQRVADADLVYEVLVSGDLSTWIRIWRSTGAENTAGPVTVHDPEPLSGHSARFMRLKVSR